MVRPPLAWSSTHDAADCDACPTITTTDNINFYDHDTNTNANHGSITDHTAGTTTINNSKNTTIGAAYLHVYRGNMRTMWMPAVAGVAIYYTVNGKRHPGAHNWEGMQTAKQGDRIGMLLDFDQGSMTVWKNGVRLGVMQAEGLSGPLCWVLSIFASGSSARIGSAPAPASSTEEELAAATAWEVVHPP